MRTAVRRLPSPRQTLVVLATLALAVLVLVVQPDLAAAQKGGNPLENGANNALATAKVVLAAVFVILLGFMALRLFAQRNFGGLAITLLVGAVVAWIIFDPKGAGDSLQNVGDSIFKS
jgi:hypothetical protein